MRSAGERLREVLSGTGTINAAIIFDPVSARVAEMRGLDICYMGGSVMKSAALALPDDVALTNLTDLVDIGRRITAVADVSLIMDLDDAGGSALGVYRTVRDLEAVGVAGIEIEDNSVPRYYGEAASRHALMLPMDEQVERYKAAVAARRNPATVIIARTAAHALQSEPGAEFLERIAAYAQTGVDAIVLPSLDHHGGTGKADVEAARRVTNLPFITIGLAWELQQDHAWLAANGVRITVIKDNWAYRMAVKAIDDCLAFLDAGGNPADLADRCASLETVRKVMTRRSEYEAWSRKYDRSSGAS